MDEFRRLLENNSAFTDVGSDEIDQIFDIADQVSYSADQIVFKQGEPADRLYLIATGAIDLFGYLSGDIERVMMTVREGGVVGTLAMFGQTERSFSARAAEDTTALAFDMTELSALIESNNQIGVRILRFLTGDIAERLQVAIESLHQNLEWTLEVSGVAALNLKQLILDRAEITVELVTGKRLTGTILKAEEHDNGFELFLSTAKGNVHFIPYHAIVDVSLQKNVLKSSSD